MDNIYLLFSISFDHLAEKNWITTPAFNNNISSHKTILRQPHHNYRPGLLVGLFIRQQVMY